MISMNESHIQQQQQQQQQQQRRQHLQQRDQLLSELQRRQNLRQSKQGGHTEYVPPPSTIIVAEPQDNDVETLAVRVQTIIKQAEEHAGVKKAPPPPQVSIVGEPRINDVLLGRGIPNLHKGTVWYRNVIKSNRQYYLSAPKHTKKIIAEAIVEATQQRVPSGRFLKQKQHENGYSVEGWVEVSFKQALDKTSQALRERYKDRSIKRKAQKNFPPVHQDGVVKQKIIRGTSYSNTISTPKKQPPAAAANNDGSLPPQQPQQQSPGVVGQPVESDHAINYVLTIKKRFADQPETYKRFLKIFHSVQHEQDDIKEVLEEVSVLFEKHPDLLEEFSSFLTPLSKAKRSPNDINFFNKMNEALCKKTSNKNIDLTSTTNDEGGNKWKNRITASNNSTAGDTIEDDEKDKDNEDDKNKDNAESWDPEKDGNGEGEEVDDDDNVNVNDNDNDTLQPPPPPSSTATATARNERISQSRNRLIEDTNLSGTKRKTSSINTLRHNEEHNNEITISITPKAAKLLKISSDDKTSMVARKLSMGEALTEEAEMGQEQQQQQQQQKEVDMVLEQHQQKEDETQGTVDRVGEGKQQEHEHEEEEEEELQADIYQEVTTAKDSVPIPLIVECGHENSRSDTTSTREALKIVQQLQENLKKHAATTTVVSNNKTSTNFDDNKIEDQQRYIVKLEQQVRECVVLKKEKEQLRQRVHLLESQSKHNTTMAQEELRMVRSEKEQLQHREQMYMTEREESTKVLQQCTSKIVELKERNKFVEQQLITQNSVVEELTKRFKQQFENMQTFSEGSNRELDQFKTYGEELMKQLSLSRLEKKEQEKRIDVLTQQMRIMHTKVEESKKELESVRRYRNNMDYNMSNSDDTVRNKEEEESSYCLEEQPEVIISGDFTNSITGSDDNGDKNDAHVVLRDGIIVDTMANGTATLDNDCLAALGTALVSSTTTTSTTADGADDDNNDDNDNDDDLVVAKMMMMVATTIPTTTDVNENREDVCKKEEDTNNEVNNDTNCFEKVINESASVITRNTGVNDNGNDEYYSDSSDDEAIRKNMAVRMSMVKSRSRSP